MKHRKGKTEHITCANTKRQRKKRSPSFRSSSKPTQREEGDSERNTPVKEHALKFCSVKVDLCSGFSSCIAPSRTRFLFSCSHIKASSLLLLSSSFSLLSIAFYSALRIDLFVFRTCSALSLGLIEISCVTLEGKVRSAHTVLFPAKVSSFFLSRPLL